MKRSIATLCPVFNTNRMVQEYAERFYVPAAMHSTLLRATTTGPRACSRAWKERVTQHWHEISILSVEADTSKELEIGSELEILVRVLLGSLTSDEIYGGGALRAVDSQGEIVASEAIPLDDEHDGRLGRDLHGKHAVQQRWAARVPGARPPVPSRGSSNKFETGKITWWTGDAATPSEAVAEKVSSVSV